MTLNVKNRWTYVISAFVIAIIAILSYSESASACSCAVNESVAEAYSNNDAVFEGTVTGMQKKKRLLGSESSADPVTWSFQVNEVWKGKVAPAIAVTSAQFSESCGYEFRVGERYLVYAKQTGSALQVSLCSRTALYSEAGEDLTELGLGSTPPQPAGEQADSVGLIGWLTAAVVIGAALFAFVQIRRRKDGASFKSKA